MAETNFPVVVFDIDDTLYPELDYIRSGLRSGGAALGPDIDLVRYEEAYVSRFLAGQRENLVQTSAADLRISLTPERVRAFLKAYAESAHSQRLRPAQS
jgi:hypothetical protein